MRLRDETQIALEGLRDAASEMLGTPVLRLGVTGLSRAGKTVFITALVHALLHGTRLPLFSVQAQGRLGRVWLEPQPDDRLPRFAYEDHIAALTAGDARQWPESTRRMSQLRLTMNWTSARRRTARQLHLDILDYPGEWLLDLPLLSLSYAEWSAKTLAQASEAADWLVPADGPPDEQAALHAARRFTVRGPAPGRFLMPGDLEGSPLLAFAPLALDGEPKRGSLGAMMARRYDAYVRAVVRPFFFDHFARLDRQIVLADALGALNDGPEALADLGTALKDVLVSFRHGPNSLMTRLIGRRIDRILFAATKADLLHHSSHDRLEAILASLLAKADYAGAETGVAAIAAVRATREARVRVNGEELASIVGTPQAGETLDGVTFDGTREAALFPGDLPRDPGQPFTGELRFLKLRPPVAGPLLPHIRLDKALEFLLGDRLT